MPEDARKINLSEKMTETMTQSTKKQRKPLSPKTKRTIVTSFWVLFAGGFLVILGVFLYVWFNATIPDMAELESPKISYASQVISSDGVVLTTYFNLSQDDEGNRAFVGYDELPQNLIDALIATEDSRFYSHSGIDFRALTRVAFKTLLLSNKDQGGGSTITQQLAKKLYKRSASNIAVDKFKEWIIAVKLEWMYTKEEIIVMYLNKVEFGSNTHGIKNAAETFFGKQPIDLTVEESAVLVGMLSANTRYNPRIHPQAALQRRNLVLSRMVEAGTLDAAMADSLRQTPINLDKTDDVQTRYQQTDNHHQLKDFQRGGGAQ